MSDMRNNPHGLSLRAVIAIGAALVPAHGGANAHEYEVGTLKIEHPWLRTPADGQKVSPLFMHIHNNGETADKLVGVKSDKLEKIVIHASPEHIVQPHGIVIPPHSDVTLGPDGPFVDLSARKLNPVGWGFEVTLVFEKAGEVTIDAAVEAPDAMHAHDAEAMQRWEKAHAAPTTVPPQNTALPDNAGGSNSGAVHTHNHDCAQGADPYAAERNSMDHSHQNHGVPGPEPCVHKP